MTRVLNPTKFTPLQLELLKFYSMNPSEEEILEVKRFLAKMFWKKAIKAIGEIEARRGSSNDDLDELLENENQ